MNWDRVVEQLAAAAGVAVYKDHMVGLWHSRQVDGGRLLAGYEMASKLRLLRGGAVGVLSFGWLDYKEACASRAMPWPDCVNLTEPADLAHCASVFVSKDAHKRHDWRVWAPRLRGVVPADQLVRWTAAPDLTVSRLAELCGVSYSTALRYSNEYKLPRLHAGGFKGVSVDELSGQF